MGNSKHEDAIMKMGFRYFRDTILKLLGIDHTYVDVGPTELVELTIHSLYMDFTFLTTSGQYVHAEFQTTNGGEKDLRRFHAYEAVLSHESGKSVITYVIYSGGIKKAKAELDCGAYTYRVIPVYMTARDAEEIFTRLQEKRKNGKVFTEQDFAELSLTPLMSSPLSKKDTLKEAMLLAKTSNSATAQKSMAILYTLADKFLDNCDLEEIKEVTAMTRLGQMLYDDGFKSGSESGSERMTKLTRILLEENRLEDLKKVTEDKEFCEELMKKYNIQ